MLDAFSRQAVSADSSGSFIGGAQLSDLKAFIAAGNKRLDAVNAITATLPAWCPTPWPASAAKTLA